MGPIGITVEGIATYGSYYRLRCSRCGEALGSVGDKLLPGMARQIVDEQFELYASGRLGCKCSYQLERDQVIDPPARARRLPLQVSARKAPTSSDSFAK